MNQKEKVNELALSQVGYKETGTNINKYAADIDAMRKDGEYVYNYPKQGVAWCDVFHDWLFITSFGFKKGIDMICQPEKSCGAGCKFSAEYYRKAGRWFTTPEVGDQIFFGPVGDENHTGHVTAVDGNRVYTVEGNSGDEVKSHSYALTNKKIAGYGRPKWDNVSTDAPSEPVVSKPSSEPQNAPKKSEEEIAVEVINGKWGNGKERQRRLSEAGYDYAKIQNIVNKLVAANKPTATYIIGIVNTARYPLNVRKGPGTSYPVVKTVPKGAEVKLYANMTNGWYKLADESGYVAGNLIKKKSS